MNFPPELFRMMAQGQGSAVNTARPCATCKHRNTSRFLGMRCLHPRVPSTDPIYGLPPTCMDMRGGPLCGPGGDLHSSVASTNDERFTQ